MSQHEEDDSHLVDRHHVSFCQPQEECSTYPPAGSHEECQEPPTVHFEHCGLETSTKMFMADRLRNTSSSPDCTEQAGNNETAPLNCAVFETDISMINSAEPDIDMSRCASSSGSNESFKSLPPVSVGAICSPKVKLPPPSMTCTSKFTALERTLGLVSVLFKVKLRCPTPVAAAKASTVSLSLPLPPKPALTLNTTVSEEFSACSNLDARRRATLSILFPTELSVSGSVNRRAPDARRRAAVSIRFPTELSATTSISRRPRTTSASARVVSGTASRSRRPRPNR
mmetsp:Transcript_24603/g.77646  ORF Transcript_24603/g.77646 Transcript_24603/m.77646 type:complete len:285 (-) Transcript_24603:878-1732(-)